MKYQSLIRISSEKCPYSKAGLSTFVQTLICLFSFKIYIQAFILPFDLCLETNLFVCFFHSRFTSKRLFCMVQVEQKDNEHDSLTQKKETDIMYYYISDDVYILRCFNRTISKQFQRHFFQLVIEKVGVFRKWILGYLLKSKLFK